MSKILIAKNKDYTIIREFRFNFIKFWFYYLKYKLQGYEIETLKGKEVNERI